MTFPAKYDGVCAADCGMRIHPGDPVRYDSDDRLRHDQCTPRPDPLTLSAREVMCRDCWTVKAVNGGCRC